MRRTGAATAVLVAVALGTAGAAAAPAATSGKTTKKAAAQRKCHWVKATHRRRRHKVCVAVKVKTTKKAAPVASTPVPAAATDAAPATTAPPVLAAPDPAAPATAPVVTAPAPVPGDLAPPPAIARAQASTREWSIQLSRASLAAGPVILELVNAGEDAHNLHVRPAAGGPDVLASAVQEPGGVEDLSGTLAAGTYTLYCSLPGHAAAGMTTTLTVG